MDSVKKLFTIFNRKQKLQFIGLFIVIFMNSVMEMLGVSMLIPFMQALMMPEKLMENEYVQSVMGFFHLETIHELTIFLVAVMIVVYIAKNLFSVFAQYVQYQIIWHNRLRMEIDVMTYYVRQPYMFHVQRNAAEMERTILTDIGNVFTVVSEVFNLISELLSSAALAVVLFLTSKGITIALIFLLLGFLLIYFKIFKRKLHRYGEIFQFYGAEGIKWIQQIFHGIKELKVYECESFFIREFREGRVKQISAMKRSAFFQLIPKYLLESICVGGILGVILLKMVLGADPSTMMTQLAVFAVSAYRLLPSANHITSELAGIYNNKASIDLIYTAMRDDHITTAKKAEEEARLRAERAADDAGDGTEKIELSHVSYRYPAGDRQILDDVSIVIEKGSSVALKGPSGAGKTTTADLILGILEPTGGQITFGGQNISELGRNWHKHLGYIPQSIYLSDDTIRANVAFGVDRPDDAKIWKALEEAQLKDFVESRPEGLDLMIGDGGVRISGGQRQRIGIARALYNDPDILILDEATSALDNETEAAVMESIDYLRGKKTLIIIAHRLSTIENCDVTYEVDKGKITQVK